MDKLKMAHEFMMKKMETETIDNHWELFYSSWRYADAMQAEAEKRKPSGLPEALCEVDWRQAPKEYQVTGWYIFKGVAHWIADEFPCGPAPSFGFTGNHIVERPHGF